MPRGSRLAIWLIALLLSMFLYFKGRIPTGKGEDAAFFCIRPGTVAVRLAGDFPRPGLYLYPDGVTAAAAIKMTLPYLRISSTLRGERGKRLCSGDIVTLKTEGPKSTILSLGRMKVKERMLIGIPLDPDQLDAEEWSCLPGIGPVLAARIVDDRHKNGAFGSIDHLMRVPGIGPGKLEAVKRFFTPR